MRAFDATVLHEVSEANVGSDVVLVFKTTRTGSVTLRFALTRGETAKALESRTYRVQRTSPWGMIVYRATRQLRRPQFVAH